MSSEDKRPNPTTMEGMIWNAHHILKKALDPHKRGLEPFMFADSLKGVCFINVVEAGFIFSGSVGTGIVIARDPDDPKKWSPPCAIGLTGVGFGFIVGAALKDIVWLIYDADTLKTLGGDLGVKLTTKTEAALGFWGRTAEATINVSNKGVGDNIALSCSKGVFGGLNVEGGVVNPRTAVNKKFYGQDAKPIEILLEKKVEVPQDNNTLLPLVYDKLNKLVEGLYEWEMTAKEAAEVQAAYDAAELAGKTFKEGDVVFVNVKEAAAKEAKKKASA